MSWEEGLQGPASAGAQAGAPPDGHGPGGRGGPAPLTVGPCLVTDHTPRPMWVRVPGVGTTCCVVQQPSAWALHPRPGTFQNAMPGCASLPRPHPLATSLSRVWGPAPGSSSTSVSQELAASGPGHLPGCPACGAACIALGVDSQGAEARPHHTCAPTAKHGGHGCISVVAWQPESGWSLVPAVTQPCRVQCCCVGHRGCGRDCRPSLGTEAVRGSLLPLVTVTSPGPHPGALVWDPSFSAISVHIQLDPWSCGQEAGLLSRAPPLYMGSWSDTYPHLRSCHATFLCPAGAICPAPLLCPMFLCPLAAGIEAVLLLPGL